MWWADQTLGIGKNCSHGSFVPRVGAQRKFDNRTENLTRSRPSSLHGSQSTTNRLATRGGRVKVRRARAGEAIPPKPASYGPPHILSREITRAAHVASTGFASTCRKLLSLLSTMKRPLAFKPPHRRFVVRRRGPDPGDLPVGTSRVDFGKYHVFHILQNIVYRKRL